MGTSGTFMSSLSDAIGEISNLSATGSIGVTGFTAEVVVEDDEPSDKASHAGVSILSAMALAAFAGLRAKRAWQVRSSSFGSHRSKGSLAECSDVQNPWIVLPAFCPVVTSGRLFISGGMWGDIGDGSFAKGSLNVYIEDHSDR